MHKRAMMLLNKEITELGCTEEKWQMLSDLLNTQLQSTPVPPAAIIFDDTGGTAENGIPKVNERDRKGEIWGKMLISIKSLGV